MKLLSHLILTGAMTVVASGAYAAEGDPERGAQLAAQGDGSGAPCLACHGADGSGNNAGGFPRLAGLDATYLTSQMLAYNNGGRVSPVMQPNIDNFDEQQIRDLAAYYAAMPIPETTTPANVSDDALALGEKLANEGDWDNYIPPCSSCHGPGNRGRRNLPGHRRPAPELYPVTAECLEEQPAQ